MFGGVEKLFAIDEKMTIYNQALELANIICHSEPVDHYINCYHRLKANQYAQQKIAAFIKTKEVYEEVQRFGKFHPDYQKVMKQIHRVKREMDLIDDVANFKKAENNVQAILDEVSMIIGKGISKSIKVPTGNPFFEQLSGCRGGCGTGNSCGCY